jgi:hypothetical protein
LTRRPTIDSVPGRCPGPARRRLVPAAGVFRCALLLCALLTAASAVADPEYGGLVLPGFDPVLRATEDPRLLGVERLVMRRRLLAQGVDPLRGGRPTLESTIRQLMLAKAGVNLERRITTVEANGFAGVFTEFRYPEYFFLFQNSQPMPGGFSYTPPRPVDAPEVELFVDEIDGGLARRWAVQAHQDRAALFDVANQGQATSRDQGLVNLTIPIKLPHTLEKVIGRGEKTSIKITGREHIAMSGESIISNQFTPNERTSSQSLFPQLNMEQQLQVNLSGQIGEKIIVEVDHNSEVIGPEGTKIRLSYQGSEDEIIRSIETGDVGLTLPGSQLLGYSSNKSGLFGIKVTGQVGRADFTVVASKQKAESASKAFNSKGGEVTDHIIESWDYINNRFFRLDLPFIDVNGDSQHDPVLGYTRPDNPGRFSGEQIDRSSIRIYRFVGGGVPQPADVQNVAVAADTTGRWIGFDGPEGLAGNAWTAGLVWRPVEFELYLTNTNTLIAVDVRQEMAETDLLGVVYTVVDANGQEVYRVGEDPNLTGPSEFSDGVPHYRMKLLKPTTRDPFTYQYVLRNFYSLGGTNIDAESFTLRVERNTVDVEADLHWAGGDAGEGSIAYLRVFGLDVQNAQGQAGADGEVDKNDLTRFDLYRGLLKFPLDFPFPFAADQQKYAQNVGQSVGEFPWEGTFLSENLTPQIYESTTLPSQFPNYAKFRLVSSHAAASNSFNLGATNIEEGSETVTLDGRALQRGVDYDIDYTFGQITLKGEAANLSADSQISVNYQYAPFIGGGQSSLLGFNLGYDLGRESKLTTTWLYESKQIVGHKAKLGEEPSKNVVGNLNLQQTFRPYFLTHVANALSRRDSEKESTVNLQGEVAVSIPNPNTQGDVYLEDFEGIESSDVVTLSRLGWYEASLPAHTDDPTFLLRYQEDSGDPTWGDYAPQTRVPDIRWFLPEQRVLRRYLNPALREQERDETQQALQVRMEAPASGWTDDSWGGVMRGISRAGLDLTQAQFVEFWVNDFRPDTVGSDPARVRSGKLHIDFGDIDEDFFWPPDPQGNPTVGTEQWEDANRDGVFTFEEDIGLDGEWNADRTQVVRDGEPYDAEYGSAADPFPGINNSARNNREDSEDLNGNTVVDRSNAFFSITVDLRETDPEVDVLYDFATGAYAGDPAVQADLAQLRADGLAWRKYRIRLSDILTVAATSTPDLSRVKHVRVWFDDDTAGAAPVRELQIAELSFIGSRWERDGIRKVGDEEFLTDAERGPNEVFFIGEIDNKESPDYVAPFPVHEENKIPEKEQSLVLDFMDLEPGHVARIRKQVSPQGDDYTQYDALTWYVFNPSAETADLDIFTRVGSDTLNYYEVGLRFAESAQRTGWQRVNLGMAELANAKNDSVGADGVIRTEIRDDVTGEIYRVRVVGQPDLRRVKRYYFGVANNTRWPVSGQIYLNDIILRGVKRKIGYAKRVGVRLNMADVIKVDFDWSQQDAEFRGLNAAKGQGFANQDWNLSTNFRVDDFVPLAGFQIPVSLARSKSSQRPKFETNSDIEILLEDVRNELSTLENRESFSARLGHQPSRAAVPRYIIDPWTVQLSGSRSDRTSPTEDSDQKTLQGSLNYDLRIAGSTTLARVPLVGQLPLLRGLSLLPQKISLGGNFTGNERNLITRDLDGNATPRPSSKTRTGSLQSSVDYQAWQVMTVGWRNRSERDLLRRQEVLGVNVGQENKFSQDLQVSFEVPKVSQIPSGPLFWPIRQAVKGLAQVRPSATYNGGFVDVHDPNQRQVGDPPDIRNVSNSGDWELRGRVPLGDVFKSLVPERRRNEQDEARLVQEQQRIEARERGRGRGRPGALAGTPQGTPGGAVADSAGGRIPDGSMMDEFAGLTPEERLQRDQERLLQDAEDRLVREQEEARVLGALQESRVDSLAASVAGDSSAVAAAGVKARGGGGRRFPDLLSPLLSGLRGLGQVQVSYTDRNSSNYSRLRGRAPFWYRIGTTQDIGVPDSVFTSTSFMETKAITFSTNAQLSRRIGLDIKFNKSTGYRDQAGRLTRDFTQDWPDLRLSVTGVEGWGIFGGGKIGGQTGWFKTSSLDLSYKLSRSANGYTDTYFNPQQSTTITPRWNFSLQSGMTVTLNGSLATDNQLNSGAETVNTRWRVGTQVRHDFKAQALLAKLGIYRPGNQPTITMDVDFSLQSNRTERIVPGAVSTQAPTGQKIISLSPRFSYQISRAVSGAMFFRYDRTANIATDLVTTALGLGLEATFVF